MKFYPWNSVLYTTIAGTSLNGILDLVNQGIYHANKNPKHRTAHVYNNSANKMYLRAGMQARQSTLAFGTPYI